MQRLCVEMNEEGTEVDLKENSLTVINILKFSLLLIVSVYKKAQTIEEKEFVLKSIRGFDVFLENKNNWKE